MSKVNNCSSENLRTDYSTSVFQRCFHTSVFWYMITKKGDETNEFARLPVKTSGVSVDTEIEMSVK